MSDSRDGFTVEVTFFCTGKGTHPRREIGPIVDRRRAGIADIVETVAPHADPPDARDDLGRGQRGSRTGPDGERVVSRSKSVRLRWNHAGERTWELTCPVWRCTNIRPSDAKLMAVLEAVGRGDAPGLLDISTWR